MSSQVSGVRLAERLEKEIQDLVDAGFYISSSEFIREAVREKLKNMNARNLPDEIAEKEIRWLLKQKRVAGQHLVSTVEVSQELSLPYNQVDKIISKIKGISEV